VCTCRETQLRAFYSTTEEISALFAKQQEQLKAMQKTLEDEENYPNTLAGVDLNEIPSEAVNATYVKTRDETHPRNNNRVASGTSTPKNTGAAGESSDDASTTEKHDCDLRTQDGDTQDLECTSSDKLAAKEFVSDIDGVGTAVVPDGDPSDTERVLGTESQFGDAGFDDRTAALHKCSNLAGDTMQLDEEAQIQDNLDPNTTEPEDRAGDFSQSRMEDTETGAIRTADLLASEVVGSWAVSTAPSVNGENESPRSPGDPNEHVQDTAACCGDVAGDADAAAALLLCSDGQAAGSQSNVPTITKLSEEHRALTAMIEIVAPEFGQQFLSADDGGKRNESMSDAETDKGSNASDDDDTDGDSVEDGSDVIIEDSVG